MEQPGKRRLGDRDTRSPQPPLPGDLLTIDDETLNSLSLPELRDLITNVVIDADPEALQDREEAISLLLDSAI